MKDFQKRDKFFYASPVIFPKWDYPSRLALGINLKDFSARNAPVYNFEVKGKRYSIPRDKAAIVGKKYTLPGNKMPNLIPMEEFDQVEVGE